MRVFPRFCFSSHAVMLLLFWNFWCSSNLDTHALARTHTTEHSLIIMPVSRVKVSIQLECVCVCVCDCVRLTYLLIKYSILCVLNFVGIPNLVVAQHMPTTKHHVEDANVETKKKESNPAKDPFGKFLINLPESHKVFDAVIWVSGDIPYHIYK